MIYYKTLVIMFDDNISNVMKILLKFYYIEKYLLFLIYINTIGKYNSMNRSVEQKSLYLYSYSCIILILEIIYLIFV